MKVAQNQLKQLIKKCQNNPAFWIDNFCKVEHPKAGIIPFKLFDYQRKSLNAFLNHRFSIYRKCRQCGISTLAGSFALWYAMFFTNKTILIVSKRDVDAKNFLKKNVKFVYDQLPPWMKNIWHDVLRNEHEFGFSNGSRIVSLTSSPDTLRSHASSLNIIDEAAFMPHMDDMWCVSPNTIVAHDCGVGEMSDVSVGDKLITNDFSNAECVKKYAKKNVECLKIKTYMGHEIVCGKRHPLSTNGVWRRSSDLVIGESVDMASGFIRSDTLVKFKKFDSWFDIHGKKNHDVADVRCNCGYSATLKVITLKKRFKSLSGHYLCPSCSIPVRDKFIAPDALHDDLSELIGFYIGDGYCHKNRPKRISFYCDPTDLDVVDKITQKLNDYNVRTTIKSECGYVSIISRSAKLVDFLKNNGLLSKSNAHDAEIPPSILKGGHRSICAFMRGLFEADGWCHHHIGLYSVSEKLIKQVQTALLGIGIKSKLYQKSPSVGHYGGNGFRLEIQRVLDKARFAKYVGFISSRKNNAVSKWNSNFKPTEPQICSDRVESISSCITDTNDVALNQNHSYLANGFISHNSGGWPTMQHGGSAIVISTVKGLGNWYWRFWTDAESRLNDFNPIVINWWDMTWSIKYKDELARAEIELCPTKDIRRCTTTEEIEKYGPYWSPWLEREYRNLTEKGDDTKFRQEVLAEFVGTGHTVLSRQTLSIISSTVAREGKNYKTVGAVNYVNPTSSEREILDFRNELWIWKAPEKGGQRTDEDGKAYDESPHQYIMGCDTATGEGNDFSAIEVFDASSGEQVAELKIKIKPKIFARMIDYVGRWYNNALAVVENTGIGKATCQELFEDLAYPNVYRSRRKRSDLKIKAGFLGFSTTGQSKSIIDKALIDGLGEEGYTIYSSRLYKESLIYVQLGSKTGAEPGVGNNDDLIISTGLALIGVTDAVRIGGHNLLPFHNSEVPLMTPALDEDMLPMLSDKNVMAPMSINSEYITGKESSEAEIMKFRQQLGGIMIDMKTKNNIETIKFKKYKLMVPKK